MCVAVDRARTAAVCLHHHCPAHAKIEIAAAQDPTGVTLILFNLFSMAKSRDTIPSNDKCPSPFIDFGE